MREPLAFAYRCDDCALEFDTAELGARHRTLEHADKIGQRKLPLVNWPFAVMVVGMSAWTVFVLAHAAAGVYFVWFAASP